MNSTTLEELESIAEGEFEARADKWVQAIAKREGVGFDELRPYLVSLFHDEGWLTKLVFDFPMHTLIKLESEFMDFAPDYLGAKSRMPRLVDGELVGEYGWYACKNNGGQGYFYDDRRDLGRALVLARQVHEEWLQEDTIGA